MNVIKLAICDAEIALHADLGAEIRQQFIQMGLDCAVTSYSDGRELITDVCGGAGYHLVCLDLDTPGTGGIRVARRLREVSRETELVFISAREELVFDTLALRPLMFVRKSSLAEDIRRTAEAAVRQLQPPPEVEVDIVDGLGHHQKLSLNHTVYIQARDKYLKISAVSGSRLVRYTMHQAEEALAPHHFIRVHKTYLVNARFIRCLGAAAVELDDGSSIPLSRYRAKAVREWYDSYLRFSGAGEADG